MAKLNLALFLLLTSSHGVVDGFSPRNAGIPSLSQSATSFARGDSTFGHIIATSPKSMNIDDDKTQLRCALPSLLTKVASPPVRNTLFIGSAALALYNKRRKVTSRDPNFSEPLPEGNYGCPIIGNLKMFTQSGSLETGPGDFFRYQASTVKNPSIFKYMFLSKPVVMVSGLKNVKAAFNTEFKKIRTGTLLKSFSKLFGESSLLFITDTEKHSYLRRLVGQAMTPEAINKAMPALVKGANEQIDLIKENSNTTMEATVTNFTLDVAWRTILGLDLKDDEIEEFGQKVDDWIGGIVDLRTLLLPERKMDDLSKNGPDGSTLSGMFFAQDEEDPTKKMSREEVISNALLLILAGSETAASTLTVASLALGLNKDVFKKLKEEQLEVINKHGSEELTREMLDKDCPYLDAVIKETMRIKPLAGTGAMRFAEETIVVDGAQIPKGYGVAFNLYLTHANDPAVKEDDNSHMDVAKGYRPERWLNHDTKPTEFIPFGYGPRYCLGANLALAEMKAFLALFARRVEDFELVNMTPENVTWKKASIIPKPSDGAVVKVTGLSDATAHGAVGAVQV
ncbi:hypothetical protein ACHAXS_010982 [Conticribra weissflogii]